MPETKRQTYGIEFLNRLDEFVREQGFPRRIIDSVEDMRGRLEAADTSAGVEQALLQIPDLLDHIGIKYKKNAPGDMDLPEETVSFEEIRERIEEILRLFQDSNALLTQKYKSGQSRVKEELEHNIREILHTKGHYERLRNGGSFCNYMMGAEQNYCARIRQSLQSCAEELCHNCDQHTVKIKSILGGIKIGNLRVSQRKLYQQYDSRYDLLRQKIYAMAQELAQGQNIVGKWASACVPGLERIKKKVWKKRTLLIAAPLILVLIAIPAFKFVTSLDFSKETGNVRQETVEQTDETEGYDTKIMNALADKVSDKVSDEVSDKASGGGGNRAVYLIFAAYAVYAVYIINRSRQWYCEAAGSYLAPEVERFLEENAIAQETSQKFEAIYAEVETTYRNLILEILNGSGFEEEMEVNNETQQFQVLLKEWENIRRLA